MRVELNGFDSYLNAHKNVHIQLDWLGNNIQDFVSIPRPSLELGLPRGDATLALSVRLFGTKLHYSCL